MHAVTRIQPPFVDIERSISMVLRLALIALWSYLCVFVGLGALQRGESLQWYALAYAARTLYNYILLITD